MGTQIADLRHLEILIQRLLDADLLLEEDGAALLSEADAAHQSLEAGDVEAARRHIERLTKSAEALVEMQALAMADGRSIIETARHITAEDPD